MDDWRVEIGAVRREREPGGGRMRRTSGGKQTAIHTPYRRHLAGAGLRHRPSTRMTGRSGERVRTKYRMHVLSLYKAVSELLQTVGWLGSVTLQLSGPPAAWEDIWESSMP